MSVLNSRTYLGYIEADERADRKRRQRRLAQMQSEEEEENQMLATQEAHQRKTRAQAREAALAQALAERKQQAMREEKMVQRIRDEAPELRELQAKLQAAYMTATREKQRVEKLENQQKEKAAHDRECHEMERARQATVQRELNREAQRKANLRTQKSELESQMRDRDLQKYEAYKEFQKDKQQVDEVMRKIREEDQAELMGKVEKQRQLKESFASYLHEKDTIKQHERQLADEEEQRIVSFMKAKSQQKEEYDAKVKAKQEEAQRILDEQSRAIADERSRKDQIENLLMEYHVELREERERRAEQDIKEGRLKMREDMNQANQYQQRLKAAIKQREQEEEAQFRTMMTEKFAEDERRERENAIHRQHARMDHNRQVTALMDQKRQMREEERLREIEQYQSEQETEKRRKQIVEQERQKLLAEFHDKMNIHGMSFIPKGLLQPEDKDILDLHFPKNGRRTNTA